MQQIIGKPFKKFTKHQSTGKNQGNACGTIPLVIYFLHTVLQKRKAPTNK